jgi:hypothetical protein
MLRESPSKAHQYSHSVIRVPQETDKQTWGLVTVPIMPCLGSGGQPTHASCIPKEDVYASMTRQQEAKEAVRQVVCAILGKSIGMCFTATRCLALALLLHDMLDMNY